MTKRRLLPRLVLAAILLALPAAADAPRDPPQYEAFVSESTTIRDAFTKLEWDRRNVLRNVALGVDAGCSLVASLENVGRVPTVKELLTILDEEPHDEYEFGKVVPKMIDALAFADTPVDKPYWTSTPAPGVDMFWTVSFSTGEMTPRRKTETAHARCVR